VVTRYSNTHWLLLSNIQKITMDTRQPFGLGGAGYRSFYCFIPEPCPWPSIPSRIHFGPRTGFPQPMERWGKAYSIECDKITRPLKSVPWKQFEVVSAECDKNFKLMVPCIIIQC